VIGVGEGANLIAAWANQPGGAVSSEGRTSDLGALVLVSPLADGEGLLLRNVMASLAPRIPVLIMAGERDLKSGDPVRSVRTIVERTRQNRVEFFPSSLHGYKLLRLEPRVIPALTKFLEGTVKLKVTEWEPRYNLTPVPYREIQLVRGTKPAPAAAKAKEAEPPAKAKAKDKDAAPAKKAPE
jgi:hypothetical protein